MLNALSDDSNKFVRMVVAEDTNASDEALTKLASDELIDVRMRVAANHARLPRHWLDWRKTRKMLVRAQVATNATTRHSGTENFGSRREMLIFGLRRRTIAAFQTIRWKRFCCRLRSVGAQNSGAPNSTVASQLSAK